MRKIVFGLTLLLCASAALAAGSTPEINPPANGEEWLKLTSTEKLYWALGYSQGYADALDKIEVTSGPTSACAQVAARTERQTSTAGRVSGFELVSGLEKFYSDPANIYIPIGSAIRIYLLQAAGKDQQTIQELIDTARVLGAEARRPTQK